jgi:predicted nucleotidyltransferase
MEKIRDYAAKIAERFRPEKIILFGSYAYGTPTEDSDVDILVIMDYEGRGWEKSAEISLSLDYPDFAMDLFVRRKSHINLRLSEHDPFFSEIVSNGLVLHEG